MGKTKIRKSSINLVRVPYGRIDTPTRLREYKINGTGPVGTLEEYKKVFPNKKFNVVDSPKRLSEDQYVEGIEHSQHLFNEGFTADEVRQKLKTIYPQAKKLELDGMIEGSI